jgi:hypothetical protein
LIVMPAPLAAQLVCARGGRYGGQGDRAPEGH